MKNFLRFYLMFSLIVVSFSCSDDDGDQSQIDTPVNVQFIRFGDNLVPSSIVPRTTYWDTNSNRQVTSYFDTDISGNISRLTKLVGDDGSGLSTVISFDQNGIINSLYQQDPLTGQIFNKVFVLEDEDTGNVYFGNDEGVQEISNSSSLNDYGSFLNSEDDLLVSNALNASKNIIDKLVFYANESNTNRSGLNLGVLVIGAFAVYAILMLAGSAVIVENVGESITCDYDNTCNEEGQRTTNDEVNSCPLPHSDFVCSEIVDLNDDSCVDSSLEVIIGVDPGNLLVAIVNGDSVDYDFYWSTGETNTGLISDSITAPGNGNYYVAVVDDNGCVAVDSVTISDGEDVDPQLLQATWYLVGETENGVDVFDVNACNIIVQFTGNQLIATEFYGDDCEFSDEIPSNYEVNGNVITETADGDTSFITILELTPFKMVLQEVDGDFTYVETYTNIFGTWNYDEQVDCVNTNGDSYSDDATGPFTLNSDYTISTENDSGGNYLTNSFSFENYILTINYSYQDFFSPSCGGINYHTHTYSGQFTYNPETDSFTGTGTNTENEVTGEGCVRYGFTCSSTATFTR